jgi:16S rRNA (cytosine967-C5)-methyltransferase
VEEGAWASELLLAHTRDLDSRDAGLAREIVFGCLRYQAQLDFLIGLHARRRLDPEVRIALRMGIYQIRFLDRVPPHAAVSDSVELVKAAGLRSAAGLVNAVLRRIDREPVKWPDRATELSCPAWLLERWDRQYGRDVADGIARAFLEPPETYVAASGRVQDIGSQSVVPLLDLRAGETFLDVCAAPGNKTAQALEAGVQAIACDVHPHRLRALEDLNCRRVALDATQPLPFTTKFAKVLVDAPCSGTGTLGRNPEIKWRLRPDDLADLHARQVSILRNALEHVAAGGVIVYSTCSLEREENEDVIAEAGGVWESSQRIPGRDPGDGFFAAVLRR